MDLAVKLNLALLCHAVGDYILQSDWMALNKTKRTWVAAVHATLYTVPFLVVTRHPAALAIILLSHLVIDRFRLARYVAWAKNWLAPWSRKHEASRVTVDGVPHARIKTVWLPPNRPWQVCQATGYDPDREKYLTVWLLIITDNTMHVCLNALALYLFR